jgi:hypothetical protein
MIQHKKMPRMGRQAQAKSRSIHLIGLSQRSQSARDRAMHAISAMRRDSKLSLSHAAKLEGVRPATIKKYFASLLKRSKGKLRVTKSDRSSATLYVPDANGRAIPVDTRSSKDRKALSRYLRDLGRYLRGKRNALAPWRGKTIAGVELVTSPDVIVTLEPALSEFSLYRSTNSGT